MSIRRAVASGEMLTSLPTGTVTFLFTDIEGSTRLLQTQGDRYRTLLETQASLIRAAVAEAHGTEISTEGDSFFVVFATAPDGVQAAASAQQALIAHGWSSGGEVRVRMGLHTGVGALGGDSYVGLDVHRAARIAGSAHGGQVVLSEATAHLVDQHLPEGAVLRELGVFHLKDLAEPERIFQLIVPSLPSEFPPLTTLDAVPNNLPTRLSSFVGRDRELVQAIELLESTRLLTLTGPGGSGKTRLALQVGAEVADRFADGAFFIRLDEVREPDQVPASILQALRIPSVPTGVDPRGYLAGYVTEKELLLILDNMEQLNEAGPYVAELLAATQNSKALVTSRAPLRIAGEQEMPVPPLPTPDTDQELDIETLSQFEAVALFTERARSVVPDFTIAPENAHAIGAITRALDGLPLALELVASRVKLLPPAGLLERLDRMLDATAARDSPTRQQTLRDTIGWSYDLLDEPARQLFERLSVFYGGAAIDEIERVCGPPAELGVDVLEGLDALVDQSLVVRFERGDEPRFRLFSTIRQYAAEALEHRGDVEDLRRRHAEAYAALAERARPRLTRKDRVQWLDRLSAEYANLDAALNWALEEEVTAVALRLVGSLWRFWTMRGHLVTVTPQVDSALGLPGDFPAERARALEAKGGMTYWLGDTAGTAPYYQQALEIWQDLGDRPEIANALYNLSFPLAELASEEAEAALERAQAIYEELDDRGGMGLVHGALGAVAAKRGDLETFARRTEESMEYFDQEDQPFEYGWGMFTLANTRFMQGRLSEAVQFLKESLSLFASVGDISGLLPSMAWFAAAATGASDEDSHQRFVGVVMSLVAESGYGPEYWDPVMKGFLGDLESYESDPSEPYQQGKHMSVDEAVAFALDWEPKPAV